MSLEHPAKFDWYQTTLRASDPESCGLKDALLEAFDLTHYAPAKGENGYQRGGVVTRSTVKNAVAKMCWGGQPGLNVWATGDNAPILARVLEDMKIRHRVSRVDTAIDFDEVGLFDVFVSRLLPFAQQKGISCTTQGDWLLGKKGRTLYLGSPTSAVRIRLYEKGFEQGVDRPGWIRLEAQIRPKDPFRELAYLVTDPMKWWGAGFCLEALDAIGFVHSLDKLSVGTVRKQTTEEKAQSSLIRQYHGILTRWANEVGGWDQLGPILGDRIAAMDRELMDHSEQISRQARELA